MRALKNLLRCAALLATAAWPCFASATDIDTEDGRHFSNCTVLKADDIGLYFRHRSGIARVLYEDLSNDLLASLEPLPEPEQVEAKRLPVASLNAPAAPNSDAGTNQRFRLVFWQRVVIGVPNQALHRAPYGCQTGGFADVDRYSHFEWRQAAERDFLITSGILPRPPGVITRRVPQGIRLNYF